MPENDDKAKQLIEAGTEIAGAAVGGALGFLAGGPLAAASAGAFGVVIAKGAGKLLTDVANRHLSQREEIRVGAAAAFALSIIQDRLKEGEKPRDDGFFTSRTGGRSSAEEIFEGVLHKSKNEHEEKKVRIFASIFANIAFTSGLRVGEANHILQIADNLTYRQMCLLALFHRKEEIRDLQFAESPSSSKSFETISILQEIYQLYNFGLLACTIPDSPDYLYLMGWEDVKPNQIELTPLAKRYYLVMGLDKVPSLDLRDVAVFLIV